ncbi:hypothetical protein N7462_004734 [Penicillium macrosclerotiorum]|uniref:uncharacterized protein n=1 Tax=Penicillium macrosclerotiorum TaxID=303699 RepID=UPI002548DD55|nr:uncharacterized protein N7462_004734 [Penicillium macrosclerotiorum]KAJ5690342.1 hypothetical protein N7462_004734 [Penicillium macrosclerotiorum]
MAFTQVVAPICLVTDLLQQLLDAARDTRLVVCGTRTEFLVQLSAAIRSQYAGHNPAPRHDLLTKTIGLLANSSRVQLTFCPSLETFRAYLAVLGPVDDVICGSEQCKIRRPLLATLDLVALHATTTEFAAQGLSRTFAALVESASRAKMDVILYECTNAVNPTSTDWGAELWKKQVPLLNGSVRIRGEDGGNWGGRGVSVKQVAQRWFEFEE